MEGATKAHTLVADLPGTCGIDSDAFFGLRLPGFDWRRITSNKKNRKYQGQTGYALTGNLHFRVVGHSRKELSGLLQFH